MDEDPVHYRGLVRYCRDEADGGRGGVWEEIALEGVAKGDVVLCAGVDVELVLPVAACQ